MYTYSNTFAVVVGSTKVPAVLNAKRFNAISLCFLHRLMQGGGHAMSCVYTACVLSGKATSAVPTCNSRNLAGNDTSNFFSGYSGCRVRSHYSSSDIVNEWVRSSTEAALWCFCVSYFVSEQTNVELFDGSLLLSRCGTTLTCSEYCSRPDYNSTWKQCCTGDLCNNLPIPATISLLADMKNCYKGGSNAECTGTSAFALFLADRIRACQ